MAGRRSGVALTYPRVLLGCCLGWLLSSWAWGATEAPRLGEKLSEWLLRAHGPQADTLALHWTSAREQHPQQQLRQQVIASFESSRHIRMSTAERAHWVDWLRRLPVTGRLTLVEHDARALQALATQDPVHQDGDSFVLYPRPTVVAVMGSSASHPCLVRHLPGAMVGDYVRACEPAIGAEAAVDRAWVAQPDGRTQSVGVAPWSMTRQVEPGPGAWIWAPSRSAFIPEETSDNLARFLATQVPPEQHSVVDQTSVVTQVRPLAEFAQGADPTVTVNDWGELGYWQTPSARMAQAGHVRSHISRVSPYTRFTTMLQPLEWFELGFRYTSVSNRLYGPVIAGSQAYKDKSIDVKLRLREEDATWPALAVGIRDLGGTGLFASEYVVASKRWGNWDASLGLGWGNLGTRGNIANPLGFLGDGFNRRPSFTVGSGGTANIDVLFKGPTSLFGGVQWASPSSPWVFKAELDGNSYQSEPQQNNQQVLSPINFGLVYRYGPNAHFSVALERGNRWMLGFTLQGQLNQAYSPKPLDPALPAFTAHAPAELPERGWSGVAEEIERHTGWVVTAVDQTQPDVIVHAEVDGALYLQQRIDRVIAILHALAPGNIQQFQLELTRRGLPLTQTTVNRAEWVVQRGAPLPTASALPMQSNYALDSPNGNEEVVAWRKPLQGLKLTWTPTYDQIIGGPDGFILYQLGAALNAEWSWNESTWVNGLLRLRLVDNFDKFKYTAPSQLPRVRTFAREYAISSRVTLPRLQVTHAQALGSSHYGSVYAGMLEPMFGGVGAEWLYRPFHSRWAVGVDFNHVRQRSFDQDLSFRGYRVNTGHATLYWDTGWNDVHVKLQAGRYLAGDVGATLDVRRTFQNGVAIGAWATKTNVSAAVFGEGSFDKGIYVSIPFDAMLPLSSPSAAQIVWNPLTRDGGARLARSVSLFDLTQARSPRALRWRSAQPAARRSAEDVSYVLEEPTFHPLHNVGQSSRSLLQQIGDIPASTWWWAGGAVLASSYLDKRADRWAQARQTGTWETVGTLANATPYALAAGAGVLASGLAGEKAAVTAQTSLYAGAYAIGASFAIRGLVGRSRPEAGEGPYQFGGPSGKSLKSGFVSNHTALAFALVTPFAQQHDMPWLYGVAAAAALGRVQKREHWLSDTVGGALLGYGIGSLLSAQQADALGGARIRISPSSVQADWAF